VKKNTAVILAFAIVLSFTCTTIANDHPAQPVQTLMPQGFPNWQRVNQATNNLQATTSQGDSKMVKAVYMILNLFGISREEANVILDTLGFSDMESFLQEYGRNGVRALVAIDKFGLENFNQLVEGLGLDTILNSINSGKLGQALQLISKMGVDKFLSAAQNMGTLFGQSFNEVFIQNPKLAVYACMYYNANGSAPTSVEQIKKWIIEEAIKKHSGTS